MPRASECGSGVCHSGGRRNRGSSAAPPVETGHRTRELHDLQKSGDEFSPPAGAYSAISTSTVKKRHEHRRVLPDLTTLGGES